MYNGIRTFKNSIIIAFIATSLSGCAQKAAIQPAHQASISTGPRIELRLTPGPFYEHEVRTLFARYTVRPQVAVWMETLDGSYIGTIYVTEAVAKSRYKMAPSKGRPEALPVWSGKKSDGIDALSSPTTVGKEIVNGSTLVFGLKPGRYAIMLETNRSYDWNATYSRKNSGVNGQPSIIYRAELEIGCGSNTALFEPIGTGSVDGSDSRIRPGLHALCRQSIWNNDLHNRYDWLLWQF